jgi:hypothetical protein
MAIALMAFIFVYLPSRFSVRASTSLTFQQGVDSYTGAEDVFIAEGAATTNQNSVTTIRVDGTTCTTGSLICRGILQFDISSIPTNCSVASASLEINVTSDSVDRFGVYAIRRNWGETTVTWNTYDGSNNWTTAGIDDTTNDRYPTDLMNGNSDGGFGSAGTTPYLKTHDFDSDGIALIQDWIDGDVANNGIVIMENDAGDTDAYNFTDKTNATTANRPKLTVTCNFPAEAQVSRIRSNMRIRGNVRIR